ncbi:DinB family protein [Ktedonosporobacter rubrisoli]|uniref:DinB family protein n=1 Tax=Ktedonosporobacter rubrisoli TaxID=2509675 RepID=A0A4P6JMG2_KTERU|nr:DinB family protein [Ktedonosporobacter rubrisoli]QBD76202.1 DinB family protein [Ktedonosporobacter rubrisoli]
MTEHKLSLLPFYAGWGIYNQRLVAAIAPLTGEQLALRLTPQHWSLGMYVTHIVANRAWWFHARMGEGGDDLTPLELWALGVCEADVDPCHPAAELVAGLEKTWQMIEEALARLTPADLQEVFPPLSEVERVRHAKLVEPALQPYAQMWLDAERLAGEDKPARSRQWIIWGVLAHDIHHGSEISTTLGLHGLPTIDLDGWIW